MTEDTPGIAAASAAGLDFALDPLAHLIATKWGSSKYRELRNLAGHLERAVISGGASLVT